MVILITTNVRRMFSEVKSPLRPLRFGLESTLRSLCASVSTSGFASSTI